jgi:hypothetical protein
MGEQFALRNDAGHFKFLGDYLAGKIDEAQIRKLKA